MRGPWGEKDEKIGQSTSSFTGTGQFKLKGNLFNISKKKYSKERASSASAAVAVITAAEKAGGTLTAGEAAGASYVYAVSAVFKDGEGQLSKAKKADLALDKDVDINITTVVGEALYYNVYRSDKLTKTAAGVTEAADLIGVVDGGDSSKLTFLKRISKDLAFNKSNVGISELVDDGSILPGHDKAYLLQLDKENLEWRQLGTLLKWPLAIVDTSIRWAQLLYGTPVVGTPRKNVIVKNISPYTSQVEAAA